MEIQEFVKSRNPIDYLKIFFRRKWLFIAPVFIGVVLSIVAGFIIPPLYESATVILVEEEKALNPLMQGLAVSTNIVQRMQNIKEKILGWRSLVALTKKLQLDKDIRSQVQFEGLIAKLRRNIIVQMRGPNIIRLAYFGKDPGETQIIAKTLTDILIEENMRTQTKETDVAIEFIKNQLEVYKRKIKKAEIAQLEEKLKDLLIDSTEEHPLVKELRQKIASLRKELGSEESEVVIMEEPVTNPIYQNLKQELMKLVDKEIAQEGSVAYASDANESVDPNQAIYKLMLMDKLDSVMARDMRVNENIYNMLLQKLESAKITQRLETSKEGTRYNIIDPPRLPIKPTKPNKILLVFLGLFFGSCSGAGLVLGKEFIDHSFLDIEDARQNLEFPVLGAISRITTQEEINKERYKHKKIIIITLVSGTILILISMFIHLLRR